MPEPAAGEHRRPTGPRASGRSWSCAGCRPAGPGRRARRRRRHRRRPSPRTAAASAARRGRPGGRGRRRSTTHDDHAWVPTGPTPTTAAHADVGTRSTRCSTPDRRHRPVGGRRRRARAGPRPRAGRRRRGGRRRRCGASRARATLSRWVSQSRRSGPYVRGADEDLAGDVRPRDGPLAGSGAAVEPSGLIATPTPVQRPAHAHAVARCPGRAASMLGRATMSVTGSASVIPYGVCSVAFGQSARRPLRAGRQGPARRPRAAAARRPSASVRSASRSAAGGQHVAQRRAARRRPPWRRSARTASASAVAVRVPGAVTSMAGTTEASPSAGPSRANGAKAATSRSSGVDAVASRRAVALRLQLPVRVDHALGRPGRTGGEEHGGLVVGPGRRRRGRRPAERPQRRRGSTARPATARAAARHVADRDALARPAEGAGGRQRRAGCRRPRAVPRGHRAGRPRTPSPASATTTTAPTRQQAYSGADQVDAGRNQQRDPVAAPHAGRRRGRPRGRGSMRRARPSESVRLRAGQLDHGRRGVAGPLVERRPQRPARVGRAGRPPAAPESRDRRSERSPTHAAIGVGDVRVLREQVAGALEAVHVRVRQPVEQVAQVPVREDRVARSPQQQRRDVAEPRTPAAIASSVGCRRVVGLQRDVRDEVADGRRRAAPRYGARNASRTGRRQRRVRRGAACRRRKRASSTRTAVRSTPARRASRDQRRHPRAARPAAPRCWSAPRRRAGRGGPAPSRARSGRPSRGRP